MNNTQFEQIVKVSGAFDKRGETPNYGISACRISFILKGPEGAVQFMIGTNWFTPEVQREHRQSNHDSDIRFDNIQPQGWDVGYHAKVPQYEDQSSMECDLLGGQCYYDGSSLRADDWVLKFIEGGTDWLWPELEKEYTDRFEASS